MGGVPEVLPSTYVILKEPTVQDLLDGLICAISQVQNNPIHHPRVLSETDYHLIDRFTLKSFVIPSYNWSRITDQLLDVYSLVMCMDKVSINQLIKSIWNQGLVTKDICYK